MSAPTPQWHWLYSVLFAHQGQARGWGRGSGMLAGLNINAVLFDFHANQYEKKNNTKKLENIILNYHGFLKNEFHQISFCS